MAYKSRFSGEEVDNILTATKEDLLLKKEVVSNKSTVINEDSDGIKQKLLKII